MQLYAYPVISLWPNSLVGRPFVKLLQALILLGFLGKRSDCWKIRPKHRVHYSVHPNRALSDFAEFLQNEIWSVPTQFEKKKEIMYSDYLKGRWNDHRSFFMPEFRFSVGGGSLISDCPNVGYGKFWKICNFFALDLVISFFSTQMYCERSGWEITKSFENFLQWAFWGSKYLM